MTVELQIIDEGLDHPMLPINANFALIQAALKSTASAASPVSITGAVTLDDGAFGLWHVCTDISVTPTNYTVTLPTPVTADIGKVLAIRMSSALTKLVTLDAGSSKTIDGSQTRVMWANEVAILLCVATTGAAWVKIGGKSIPMQAQLSLAATQAAFASGSADKISVAHSDFDNASLLNTGASKIVIRRAGRYDVHGQIYFETGSVIHRAAVLLYKGGSSMGSDERYASASAYAHPTRIKRVDLAAADEIELYGLQNSGGPIDVRGAANSDDTCLGVREIISW